MMLKVSTLSTEIVSSSTLPTTSGYYPDNIICEKTASNDADGELNLIDSSSSSANFDGTRYASGTVTTKIIYNSINPITSIQVLDIKDDSIISERSTIDVSFDNGTTWSTGHEQGTIESFSGTTSSDGAYQLKLRFDNNKEYDSITQVWVTAPNLNIVRNFTAGCGTVTDALCFGGYNGSIFYLSTEKWATSSWSTTSSILQRKYSGTSFGDVNNAISIGGWSSPAVWAGSEKWSTSSWATTANINYGRLWLTSCGTVSSALCMGGDTSTGHAVVAYTEKWNGTAWGVTTALNTARDYLSCFGNTSSCLSIGGYVTTGVLNIVEKWSGISWATTTSLNTARNNHVSCGSLTSGLVAGGVTTSTEKWNNNIWSTTTGVNIGYSNIVGTPTSAFVFGLNPYKYISKGIFKGFTVKINSDISTPNTLGYFNLNSKGIIYSDTLICEKYNYSEYGDNNLIDKTNTTANYIVPNYGSGIVQTNNLYDKNTAIESIEVYDHVNTIQSTRSTVDVSFDNGSTWSTGKTQGVISSFTGTTPNEDAYQLKLKFNNPSNYNTASTNSFAWSTTSTLPVNKSHHTQSGTSTNSLIYGGASTGVPNYDSGVINYKYNGTSWSTIGSLNTPRYNLSGCGTVLSSLAIGGYTTTSSIIVEKWSGTSWATTTSLTTARTQADACGTSSSCLLIGSSQTANTTSTYVDKWSGTAWATTTNLNTAKYDAACFGDSLNCISFGGYGGAILNITERYNNNVWLTTYSLNTARTGLSGCGDIYDGLCYGGETATQTPVTNTEKWNHISGWSTTSSLNQSRKLMSSSGNSPSTICCGGATNTNNNPISSCEKFSQLINYTGAQKGFTVKINQGTTATDNKSIWYYTGQAYSTTNLSCERYSRNTGTLNLVDFTNTISDYNSNYYNAGSVLTNNLHNSSTPVTSLEVYDYVNGSPAARSTIDVSFDNGSTWSTGKSQGVISDFAGTTTNEGAYQLKLKLNNSSSDYSSNSSFVWSTKNNLNTAIGQLAGCGDVNNALSFGGYSPATAVTEKWITMAWATTSSLNTARYAHVGCGTSTDALCFGGQGALSITEKWSTTAWSTTSSLNNGRYYHAGCGNVTDALCFGGISATYVTITEKWGSNTWATTSSLNISRYELAGCGTSTDALSFGGVSSTQLTTTEKWSTSAWATTTALNQARRYTPGSCGDVSSALCFGGYSGAAISTTEKWNGTGWTTTSSLNYIKYLTTGCGTSSNALNIGGIGSVALAVTEKFSGVGIQKGFMCKITQGTPVSDVKPLWYTYSTGTVLDYLTYIEKFNNVFGDLESVDNFKTGSDFKIYFNEGVLQTIPFYQNTTPVSSLEVYDFVNGSPAARSTIDVSFDNGSTWSTGKTQGVINSFAGTTTSSGTYNVVLKFNNPIEYNSGSTYVWTTKSSLNQARYYQAGCGTGSETLCFGGSSSGIVSTTEKYTGIWTTTGNLNTARNVNVGCGTISNALCIGGSTGAAIVITEKWSGVSWATTGNLNTARYGHACCGTHTDALSFGGYGTATLSSTEKWATTAWSTTTALNAVRYYSPGGCGDVTSALCFGGYSSVPATATEIWSGSSWATTTAMNAARYYQAGCGTTSSALSFGGYSATVVSTVEKWSGTAWATTSNLNVVIYQHAGSGSTSSALSFGGSSGQLMSNTEKFSAPGIQKGYICKINN